MALNTTILASDIDFMLSDLPVTAVIGGVSYSVSRTNVNERNLGISEGLRAAYMFSIYIDTDPTVAVDDTVTISGTTYRVLQKVPSGDGLLIRLDLGDRYGAVETFFSRPQL